MANYSLDFNSIEESVHQYSLTCQDYDISILKPISGRLCIRISKGNKSATLYAHLTQSGNVSFWRDGKPNLYAKCDECKEYIIEKTSLPNDLKKTLSLKNCNADDYSRLTNHLIELGLSVVEDTVSDANIKVRHIVKGANNSHSHMTYYKSGTFLLQGNITPCYVTIMVNAIEFFKGTEIEEIAESITLKNTVPTIDVTPSSYIVGIEHIEAESDILTRLIESSLILFNSGIKLNDYSCFTFGALKAVEGVLKLRMQEEIDVTDKPIGSFFEEERSGTWVVKDSAKVFLRSNLGVALGQAYTVYYKRRNTIFHVNDQIAIEQVLSFDSAWEYTKEALEAISNICKNWKL